MPDSELNGILEDLKRGLRVLPSSPRANLDSLPTARGILRRLRSRLAAMVGRP
jgi:hypothetical protein